MTNLNEMFEADATQFTQAEIDTALNQHYKMFSAKVSLAAKGKRHVLVNGKAGSAKTTTVMSVLKSNPNITIKKVNGTCSAINLYVKLYEMRHSDSVLVIDDTDALLKDNDCLDILRAALDSADSKTTVNYEKMSNALRKQDIPNNFVFNGTVVMISNMHINVRNVKSDKEEAMLAVRNRCTYIKAGFEHDSWEIESIKFFHNNNAIMCFKTHAMSEKASQEIIDFFVTNAENFARISFRMLDACCVYYNEFDADADIWQDMMLSDYA